jgi:glycosyltransferase involved in cell wall biosynthesis
VENKPRIAIVVPGGIGKDDNIPSLLDLICRIAESYDVSVYSFSRLMPHPSFSSNLCSVSFPPNVFGWSNFLTAVYFLWLLQRDHAQKKFSIVHGFWVMSQGIVAVLAGKLMGVPSMISLLGGDAVYLPEIRYGGMRNVFYRKIIQWCVGEADRVTGLTNFQQRAMSANRVISKRLSIIPFGVNTSKFVFQPKPISEPFRYSFIGNLNKVKDPYTLIKAFSLLARKLDCRLTIVGSDVLKGQVEKYARLLGVNDKIQWRGKVPHETIPSILHSTDFLLLTSLYEGEAVVVMEAFASGVIVVGTNVGLLSDVGDDRVVVMPGDAEGLAGKIEKLIVQPKVIRDMQLTNRVYAEKHTAEWTWSEYKKLYEEILRQNQ